MRADRADDQDSRKSITSSYFTLVEGNLVTWKSKKQNQLLCPVPKPIQGISKGTNDPFN